MYKYLFSVYFETYGCQMNVNDTEIAWAILNESGFQKTEDIKQVTTLSIYRRYVDPVA